MGTAPNTRAVVSQKNKIYGYAVGAKSFQQLGVVSEFNLDENREVTHIRGIGFGDQIAELVPGNTEPMTISITKTLLYTANLFQILGYKGGVDGLVRSLRHHRWPFDIKQEIVISEAALLPDPSGASVSAVVDARVQTGPTTPDNPIVEPKALLTFFEGCWFTQYGTAWSVDQAIVAESSSVMVTDIIDGVSQYGEFIDTGLAPLASQNGGPGKGFSLRFASNSQSVAGNANQLGQ